MTTGLLLFIFVNVCNMLTLLYDLWLLKTGQPTITDLIRGNQLLGVPILVIELFMVGGLAAHLFGPPDLR